MKYSYLILGICCIAACQMDKKQLQDLPFTDPPAWSQEAIWYQIFVERFRNGDSANDPTLQTMEGALTNAIPPDWRMTPWGHNWYQEETWALATGLDFYRTIQMRRYGGDLQGVVDKIPYLKELGITAIYFNPLNDAPSLHKYDARSYHHIDVNFGPDPQGDLNIIAGENPSDPTTWQWTSADRLFLSLIDQLHQNGIRVVLDFSWNHTGRSFWAFKDILENGADSPYVEWYEGEIQQDPNTGESVFEYEGWYQIKSLPEWKKINTTGKIAGKPYEGDLHPEVKQHIFDVTKRWMDPMGNGDFTKGLDGIRLDVAEHVPTGFWKDYRKFVRSVNPEFYLVGENWWEDWPDVLMDVEPWVQGDIFDAVMHYQWYKIARGYYAGTEDYVSPTQFGGQMDSLFKRFPVHTQKAMMNLGASHDSPRLLTSFFNKSKYKYNCKPSENADYQTGKPDQETYERVKLFLLHQFTFIGSPHIWNGDELGMWGADDPDNRKPLWWEDEAFEDETASPLSSFSYQTPISQNQELLDYYKKIIALRKQWPTLTQGDFTFVPNDQNLVAYKRTFGKEKIMVLFNMENKVATYSLDETKEILFSPFENRISLNNNKELTMQPLSGVVLIVH